MNRLHNLMPARRHPSPLVLSRYLEDDLDVVTRRRIAGHVRDCARCRGALAAIRDTRQALGSISEKAPAGLADSIVVALSADPAAAGPLGVRSAEGALTVLRDGHNDTIHLPAALRVVLQYCVSGPQLRLTLPLAIVAGVVLSLVNMGGMLIHGRIDLGVCLMCASDFLVPFVALNLVLLLLAWSPIRRGSRPDGRHPT